jgi:hypothetical protein
MPKYVLFCLKVATLFASIRFNTISSNALHAILKEKNILNRVEIGVSGVAPPRCPHCCIQT